VNLQGYWSETTLKKCLKRIRVLLLCGTLLAAAGLPEMRFGAAAIAQTTDYLNLRQGAGTNTGVIVTIPRNTAVTVLDSSDSRWIKVKLADGRTGYCAGQYLTSSGSVPVSLASSGSKVTAVTTDSVNLRSSASLSAGILTVLSKGTSLSVIDNSNAQWAKVSTSAGKQGWCSKSFLKISSSASSGSTTATVPAGTTSTASGLTAKTTDYLNLRASAAASAKVLQTLSKGVTLTVLDNSDSKWVKVRTSGGEEGWCSRQYLSISGSGSAASSKPSSSQTPSSQQSSSSSPVPSSSASSDGGTGTGGAGTGGTDSGVKTVTSAVVTADVLRLRASAGVDAQVLANLTNGTSLTVLDASNSDWIKVQTSDGKTGYVSSAYVRLTYSDGSTTSTGGSGTSASTLTLSASSQSVPLGKTLYLKASVSPDDADVVWSSSNAGVANVSNGYVTAVGKGSAVITASSGSCKSVCRVSVADAEPVRTAYASPNVTAPGATVTFTAVTDSTRTGVQFIVTKPDGGTTTVTAGSNQQETTNSVVTKKWTGTASFTTPGTYSVLAVSAAGGGYSSAGFTTSVFIATQSDYTVTTSEERRVSDQMISLISQWEGYRAAVYADTLSYNSVATIGYGCTLGANAVFYNNMSQTEAWSMMVNKINASSYTTELNKMVQNNKFLMSQNQADCLISFAYNVGSGYFNSTDEMDFIKIMKNAVVPPAFSSGTTYPASITLDTVIRAQSGNLSAVTGNITAGTALSVTGGDFSDPKDGWYHVQLNDGTTGWINSAYVSFNDSTNMVHDLNYTNAYAFGTELIRWNQAGGKFYTGLFYRRLGEANVYNYNDYTALRSNKYGYTYPSVAASLG
jgi:uncharacterized protein YgiM (DUF1202 family)